MARALNHATRASLTLGLRTRLSKDEQEDDWRRELGNSLEKSRLVISRASWHGLPAWLLQTLRSSCSPHALPLGATLRDLREAAEVLYGIPRDDAVFHKLGARCVVSRCR